LRAHDGIGSGPADTGQDVEDGDYRWRAMLAFSDSNSRSPDRGPPWITTY
jgi:hypothetical protein